MRKRIIAGNWKMNKNSVEAAELARAIVEKSGKNVDVEIVVCPPFTSIAAVGDVIRGTNVKLGAQNMHWEEKGAYTGEISANMLLTLGCEYVILGHSERRTYFHETDEIINLKLKSALKSGLKPIVCVGETRQERESGVTEKVIETQVRGAFKDITPDGLGGVVIAYEPVWAIGTGLTATTSQAEKVHGFIRKILEDMFGVKVAENTRIQYGGSMNPANAAELLREADIDGGLIGGAALNADNFDAIIKS